MIEDFFKVPGVFDKKAPIAVCPAEVRGVKEELKSLHESETKREARRGNYEKTSAGDKARVAEYASKNGVLAAIRHFKQTGEFANLKESTVRGWKSTYCMKLAFSRKRDVEVEAIVELPEKRRGRPLLIGEELEDKVKWFLTEVRKSGGVVNSQIAVGAAKGVIKARDANLLAENGGSIDIGKDWAHRLLGRMGLVKRQATTKAKVSPSNFAILKHQFLDDIRSVAMIDEIPQDLIINWDQTGVKYVPVSNWTMEVKGSKRVEVAGVDDKRQITALLSITMSGKLLPVQVVYKGKTPACLPKVPFPDDWHVTFTTNHWSNEETMMGYLHCILLPYIEKVRKELKLSATQRAFVIFDQFKAQNTEGFLQALEKNNISVVGVPPNCTDRLQPLDVSVNKPLKSHMKNSFQQWYSDQVERNLARDDSTASPIDLKLSILKPLGFQWLVNACAYVEATDIIRNGFRETGITDVIQDTIQLKE